MANRLAVGYYNKQATKDLKEELISMSDEIEDDVAELELKDDALELKIKKLESEATRLLHHSNELLKALNKEASKKEELNPENSEVKDPEESKIPS